MNANAIARYEYKYVVTPEQADALRHRLRPYCVMDEHSVAAPGGFYVIDSLYFDDHAYRCFRDAEEKAPRRVKLRVRTYGQPHASIVKFEVKRRMHDLVVKSSAVMAAANWPQWLSPQCRCGATTLPDAMKDFISLASAMHLRPKMLVRYERQAFRSAIDHYVRVTFDRRMQYQPMQEHNLSGDPHRWMAIDDGISMGGSRSGILLELKFITAAPSWLVDIVRQFGLMRQGYSKYGSAVRRRIAESLPSRDLVAVRHSGRPAWIA